VKAALLALIALFVGTGAVSAETVSTPQTRFTAIVAAQARINVDAEGDILSIHNVSDGSDHQPQLLNVYCGDTSVPMTPAIQANLASISARIEWSQGGTVYRKQVEVCFCDEILRQRA